MRDGLKGERSHGRRVLDSKWAARVKGKRRSEGLPFSGLLKKRRAGGELNLLN